MLSGILTTTLLLFAVSFGNNKCGSVVYSDEYGRTHGFPIGKCGFISGESYKYVCDETGFKINEIRYNTIDCSGDPSYTRDDICQYYSTCSTICSTSDCNNGVFETIYDSSEKKDCSGDNFKIRNIYLIGYCLGSLSQTTKVICNNNLEIQFNSYENYDCSGDPITSNKYNTTTCFSDGFDAGLGNGYKYEGCGESDDTDDTDDTDDSCSTFKLFIAVITAFIVSLLYK